MKIDQNVFHDKETVSRMKRKDLRYNEKDFLVHDLGIVGKV